MKKTKIILNLMQVSMLCVISIAALGVAGEKSEASFPMFAFDN